MVSAKVTARSDSETISTVLRFSLSTSKPTGIAKSRNGSV